MNGSIRRDMLPESIEVEDDGDDEQFILRA
jgi:hypothetical protein